MKFFLAAVVAAATSPISQISVEGEVVDVTAVPSVERCYDNRLLADPTSRRVAVWEGQRDLRDAIRPTWPTGFTVADLPSDDAPQGFGPSFAWVHGPLRVDPLRWSATGDKLLLRAGKIGAALFDPAVRQLVPAPDFDPLWTWMAIEAIRHGDTGFYRQPVALALVRRIREEGSLVRWLATVGADHQMTVLVSRDGMLRRLTAYEGDAHWNTGIPLPFATAPLLPPGTKRMTFLGDQSGFATFLPYAMPLIDHESGRIAGRFGLERIELSNGRKLDLGNHFSQLMTIQDASANGDTIFALVDLEREKRIVRIRGRQVRSWQLCEKKALQLGNKTFPHENALPAGLGVKRTLVRLEAGGREAAPFALLYRPRRADGRLVVYFHGGPTATLAKKTVPDVVSRFAPEGISVLAVEQSGMLGGGLALSERLPRLGFEALRQDVASATRWIRRSGYRRAFLIGDSFGGASGVIAATEHAPAYEHIFLRVPYLKVRTAKEDARPLMFGTGSVPPERQQEFFETVIGGGPEGHARFAAALRASVARLRPSPRLSLYFGTLDTASKPGDLPPAFAGHPSVTIIKGLHEIAPASAWDDILVKMGSREPKRKSDFR